ncbi:predicted protein [Sclerotinia sclerotiorum 1980 UF-70]|uniref:Uncharacterized protein n=1 Tax=Sclerotinia sclerotiorum (strain ATCC 18683 / 1980 / Ss-1) TaxID=665079 RepID=A7ES26_SCLS1|nr:predicted protein [Sclerotinia sclerotiorum 1980 UF-70]EDN92268.1 predicted protein [Sclerotinia sclerotiorum 1980 UF-70]
MVNSKFFQNFKNSIATFLPHQIQNDSLDAVERGDPISFLGAKIQGQEYVDVLEWPDPQPLLDELFFEKKVWWIMENSRVVQSTQSWAWAWRKDP